jgi:hypothetical protein
MALEGEQGVVAVHPLAVVPDADLTLAAPGDADVDRARAGIQGILDQLLDDGGRPVDDLARRDAVDGLIVENANPAHQGTSCRRGGVPFLHALPRGAPARRLARTAAA